MFAALRPKQGQIEKFIYRNRETPFSYEEVGYSREGAPPGYVVDHNRVRLGSGATDFQRARTALSEWKMFDFGWVELCWPKAGIDVGVTVAVLARPLGLWTLNACRIIYTVDAEEGGIHRFGFAYGTLPDHAESGEERFLIEWDRRADEVYYDLYAFSRPNHPLSRLGYPVARSFQRRFARDSRLAMSRAVRSTAG